MPTNIEIKARVRNPTSLRDRLESLSDTPEEVLEQVDTFFRTDFGRLKLRHERPDFGVLIDYERANHLGPRPSRYTMAETADPEALRAILSRALGTLGNVRKVRHLYRRDRTRLHLDAVEGLGWFLEIEVVLGPGDSPEQGRAVAEELMVLLEIAPGDLVELAYFDLLGTRDGDVGSE
jgi:adenylate cyclase class IV